jgi:hypothetical protein
MVKLTPDLLYQIIPAATAVVSLLVLLLITLRFRNLAAALKLQGQSGETALAGLKGEITSVNDRLARLESEPHEIPTPNPVTVRAGMNLNKRTQALRQYRLGQGSAEIARTLEMPKAEIDLLVKVQRIVSKTMSA